LLDGLDDTLLWEQAIAAEPPPQRWMTGEDIDAAFRVVGTFTDLKSYWLRGHAKGTSQLAEAAAWRLGLSEGEVTMVRRAALALDLGAAAGHRVAKRPRELPAGLTDRELEVLLALAGGQTNQEIAETLGISAKTAGHHVQHILEQTGARTRTAATVWAFERHLVQSA
jgi:DNA-binding CsgD family transcriptional regulator